MSSLVPRDIFVKKTDPTGKHRATITQHRVWNAERFMDSQVKQHNGEKTKPEDIRHVSIATAEEYAAARQS